MGHSSKGSSAQRRSWLSQCGSLFCLWHKTSACTLYCLYQPEVERNEKAYLWHIFKPFLWAEIINEYNDGMHHLTIERLIIIPIIYSKHLGSLDLMTRKCGQNENALPLCPSYVAWYRVQKVLGKTQVHIWLKEIKEEINMAGMTSDVLNSECTWGSMNYTHQIKQQFPMCLHAWTLQNTTKILGDNVLLMKLHLQRVRNQEQKKDTKC